MKNESRTVYFDKDLNIEAYHLKGIIQKFPNHFHEYYVIGYIEKGKRQLHCKNKEYIVDKGDLVIFNPYDNHTCQQIDGKTLDYRCINIKSGVMKKAVMEVTGKDFLPYFSQTVFRNDELIPCLKGLHTMVKKGVCDFKKEESFLFLIGQLVAEYADNAAGIIQTGIHMKVELVCNYLKENISKNITLDDLSAITGLSKYYLLRSFTKQKGISPYCYLETLRIAKSQKLLEMGTPPIEVALQTGFSDQSHFTNFYKKLTGLTPKQYMNIFVAAKNVKQPQKEDAPL